MSELSWCLVAHPACASIARVACTPIVVITHSAPSLKGLGNPVTVDDTLWQPRRLAFMPTEVTRDLKNSHPRKIRSVPDQSCPLRKSQRDESNSPGLSAADRGCHHSALARFGAECQSESLILRGPDSSLRAGPGDRITARFLNSWN
jgi:hypothetical protein